MKTVKADLPKSLESVEVHTFADWHIGDKACRMQDIRDSIEYIRTHDSAYCILNGDLLNAATKASVSDIYAEEIMPMDGVKLLIGLLEPIKDKILFVAQGNHEARYWRESGLDITYLVCSQLGIQERYCREGGVLFLRMGWGNRSRQLLYTFLIWHGSGGGRKEGAKAIRLADMACIVDTDIYIHSHTHLPMIFKEGFFRLSDPNSAACHVERLFVNTSAKLDYGGYGQQYEFKPAASSTPVIYLGGRKKSMWASL